MDQLLLGYGSSEEDDFQDNEQDTATALDHSNAPNVAEQTIAAVTASADGHHPSNAERAEHDNPNKRQKLDTTQLHDRLLQTANNGSRTPLLPNPLALLEASSNEERQSLLLSAAASASVAPGALLPLQPPLRGPSTARVRSFPHVVGNFPTVVLLPVVGREEALDAVYRKLRRVLPDLEPMSQDPDPAAAAAAAAASAHAPGSLRRAPRGGHLSSLGNGSRGVAGGVAAPVPPPPPQQQSQRGYHISLSRTVPIRHPQITPLTSQLSESLRDACGSFSVTLEGCRSFANDEGTRSFVSLMVTHGSAQVCDLIRRVDTAFKQHGLPPFYEEPLPHVSVGWLAGDQRSRIDAALQRLRGTSSPSPPPPPPPSQPASQQQQQQKERGQELGKAAASACGKETVVCSFQVSRAVCVVGQREYEVWRR
ncbi:hypothetical protein Agub_g168 [Astrephomene gubernaculifera]|uniref:U6 snRNA phosphodiesterase 1 n=1 Tax=Astrephomene gubernaculifera TaxID=47775 RepID=A0AAD3DFB8_9CHLO|nr:hypothetical protein Agub_g168 [Astrephomene gubernaculifera]